MSSEAMATDVPSVVPGLMKLDSLSSGIETGLLSRGSKRRFAETKSEKVVECSVEENAVHEEEDDDDEVETSDSESDSDEDPLAGISSFFDFDEYDDDIPCKDVLCEYLPRHGHVNNEDWPEKIPYEEYCVYHDDVYRTTGFDVRLFTYKNFWANGGIQPAITEGDHLDDIIRCAKAAVKRENLRRRLYNKTHPDKVGLKQLKLHRIIKAMSQLIMGEFSYFLTIKVLEGEVENTYETRIRSDPPPEIGNWAVFRQKANE